MEPSSSLSLSPNQIDILHGLIRRFKLLGKRYAESNVPKLVEFQSMPPLMDFVGDDNIISKGLNSSQNETGNISEKAEESNFLYLQEVGQNPYLSEHSIAQFDQQPVISGSLSWQCFHTLLFYGLGKSPSDGSVSFSPSDIGCFSKGAHLPLVLSKKTIINTRELLLEGNRISSDVRLCLQRSLRAQIMNRLENKRMHIPLISDVNTSQVSNMLNYSSHLRTRKQSRRELKGYERDEKRRKTDIDERKKKRQSDFLKAILDHRETFLNFHKYVKSELSKTSRLVKIAVENLLLKKEKDEAKLEVKRLQALKENDMESYMSLIQHTKNGRLKFLLNETENYIATIDQMIQKQRSADDASETARHTDNQMLNFDGSTLTKKSKDYLKSTHRTVEEVMQPRLLNGGTLQEYQLSGLQWLVSLYNNNLNGILADEMGLGKTIQSIALLSYLMENKGNNGPFLVVVPLSTLSNWANEFNKWAPDIIKVIYKGLPEERRRIFKEDVETRRLNVLITTYEYIMKDKSSLKRISWQYIIVDEGHRMKNAQSKFAQTLGTSYQSKHRLLLTGTPLQNNLPELWSLLNFLLPSIFSSVDTFDQWFNKPFAAFRNQNVPGDDTAGAQEDTVLTQEERMLIVHRLHEVLRPFVLRRVKDQVLDQLPGRVEKILKCPLSGWQLKMYRSIVSKGLNNKEKEGGLNNTIMQLRKVCNHPYLFLRSYDIDDNFIRVSGKFELLDRMVPKLKAAGHRILLFSQMVEVIYCLERFFALKGLQYLRLDGSTNADEREKRMFAFNDPCSPYFVFLLSTRAGGLGLNLATADTVIIFDSDWNPMVDAQAQDRAHRIGQKNEVRVFRLLTNSPVEERILSRANDKKNLTELVVEAGKFNSRVSGSLEDNKEMMESLLNEWSMGGQGLSDRSFTDYDSYLEDCAYPEEEELNQLMSAYDGEFELYENMDKGRHNLNNPKLRLADANDRPVWLTEDCWNPKYPVLMKDMMSTEKYKKRSNVQIENAYDDDEDGGLSMPLTKAGRVRKEVVYDDGLTDLQFSRMIEQEQTLLEKKGKPGRKRKDASLSPFLKGLVDLINEIQKIRLEDGSYLAHLFLDKPLKSVFPDYYSIIASPISLKDILEKIKNCGYKYFEEIELDFSLMSDNARVFNGNVSRWVYDRAEMIRNEFYNRSENLRRKYNVESLSGNRMPPLPDTGYNLFSRQASFKGLIQDSLTSTSAKDDQATMLTFNLPFKQKISSMNQKDNNSSKLYLSVSAGSKA